MTISNEETERAVDIVDAVGDAVGPHIDLLIECHGRFNPIAEDDPKRPENLIQYITKSPWG
jgi:L-alanine-DL-glutamate epimerase-like enolase superfamily enzyme